LNRATREHQAPVFLPIHPALLAVILFSVFALYLFSAEWLGAQYANTYFGADGWHYSQIAEGKFFERSLRFHPVTVLAAFGWMKIFQPLTAWLDPFLILRAMFALIGTLGVWAAISAFATMFGNRYAALLGIVYASTLGIWYFSSIEETKIISATLAAVYIAIYLHLREDWTLRRAIALTAVLLVACLNEIVAGLLVVIPALDALIRRGLNWRDVRWIGLHAMAGVLALVLLEILARLRPDDASAEAANHFGLLLWYIMQNDYSLQALYAFVLRWFLFNLAAPEAAVYDANPDIGFGGDFAPSILNYFGSPGGIALVIVAAAIAVISVWKRPRRKFTRSGIAIVAALGAYIFLRGTFFFVWLPSECMLYAPSITLALLLIAVMPLMRSTFAYKNFVLGALAAAMLLANGFFIFTAQTFP